MWCRWCLYWRWHWLWQPFHPSWLAASTDDSCYTCMETGTLQAVWWLMLGWFCQHQQLVFSDYWCSSALTWGCKAVWWHIWTAPARVFLAAPSRSGHKHLAPSLLQGKHQWVVCFKCQQLTIDLKGQQLPPFQASTLEQHQCLVFTCLYLHRCFHPMVLLQDDAARWLPAPVIWVTPVQRQHSCCTTCDVYAATWWHLASAISCDGWLLVLSPAGAVTQSCCKVCMWMCYELV